MATTVRKVYVYKNPAGTANDIIVKLYSNNPGGGEDSIVTAFITATDVETDYAAVFSAADSAWDVHDISPTLPS